MANKNKGVRSGGKYTGSHTTVVPAAETICDIAHALPCVTKISLGIIKAGLRSAHGNRRVKIIDKQGAILLSIRDNNTNQEIYVYAMNLQAAKDGIKKGAEEAGLRVSYVKEVAVVK